MKDYNRPDWTTLITTLGNRISSGNRIEEVDMSMWDTLFPLAKEESCGTHVVRHLTKYNGDKYELFTDISGTPLCINKIIERITLNKKARQIEWSEAIIDEEYTYYLGSLGRGSIYTIYERSYFDRIWVAPRYDYFDDMYQLELSSVDQAKQACQDHLQAYVNGLYLQLQELTEDL